MASKPKILTFVGFYLPGYKAGGPLRTIANMVDHLGDDFEFWIVTSDRDLGDTKAYPGLLLDQWLTHGNARVFYLSPKNKTVEGLANVIKNTPHDVLYLNSFFDPVFTLKPLLARFRSKFHRRPLVLAPRGEFSPEALKIRGAKKSVYMFIGKLLGLYKGVTWQASSEHEAEDIRNALGVADSEIFIASDLPSKTVNRASVVSNSNGCVASRGVVRIVFLSRISPMKNLDYALRILACVRARVIFDIYGPIEDFDYWQECQELVGKLSSHVEVHYRGAVAPSEVSATFAQYDLFLFPSRGENYGHVIAESLEVGTSVLISDRTPWRNLAADGLGWDLALTEMGKFVEVIEGLALKNSEERKKMRHLVKSRACERLLDPAALASTRELFLGCLSL